MAQIDFLMMSPKGYPVFYESGKLGMASIYINSPIIRIIVGDPFIALSNDEKKFILLHEEGHIDNGVVDTEFSYETILELEHNCDLVGANGTSIKIGLSSLKKMKENQKAISHPNRDIILRVLDDRAKKLNELLINEAD